MRNIKEVIWRLHFLESVVHLVQPCKIAAVDLTRFRHCSFKKKKGSSVSLNQKIRVRGDFGDVRVRNQRIAETAEKLVQEKLEKRTGMILIVPISKPVAEVSFSRFWKIGITRKPVL